MVYLLLGEDLKAKDAKIASIKSAAFKNPEALVFDFELLDANGIAPDALKKALITLPVINQKRLVIVHNVHKLKANDVAALSQFMQKSAIVIDLILESSEASLKAEWKDIITLCQTQTFALPPKPNVFDMTKLMTAGRSKEALNMLSGFYQDGTHPLQILGGLAWFWGKDGRRLAPAGFEMGLKALEEADVNIKRSRLDANYAVEKVVVELSGFLASSRR